MVEHIRYFVVPMILKSLLLTDVVNAVVDSSYYPIKDLMYIDLADPKACVRRLTTDNHQYIGCQSASNGNVGVIHFIKPKVYSWSFLVLTTIASYEFL